MHWKKDNFVNFFLPLNHFFWIPIENLGILGAVKVHSHPPFVKFSQIFGSDCLAEMSVQRTDAILSPVLVRRVSLLSGGNGLSHWFCCFKK